MAIEGGERWSRDESTSHAIRLEPEIDVVVLKWRGMGLLFLGVDMMNDDGRQGRHLRHTRTPQLSH